MTSWLLLLMKLGQDEDSDTSPICGQMTFRTAITGYMKADQAIDGKMHTEATIGGYMEVDSCQ